ncbi:MAG: class I SAM-dependent methyltransferase [Deltaproteobacteria bacterium]|nr:class I SAM-dependent methyltransferase [Deltaproteobacteria bacterium]
MSDGWNALQRDHYDHFVEGYEEEGEARKRGYARKARALAEALRGVTGPVLEVGAGSGLVTVLLAPRLQSPRYVALDLSPEMLAFARKRVPDPRVECVVGDATRLDAPDGAFEAVFCVDVVHHLDRPVEALREWARVVRPGGRLVLLEANAYNPMNRAYLGVEFELRVFLNTDANLARWVTEAGWVDVRVEPAPAYTPSGPRVLGPVLDLVDRVATRLPPLRRWSALWQVEARRGHGR